MHVAAPRKQGGFLKALLFKVFVFDDIIILKALETPGFLIRKVN